MRQCHTCDVSTFIIVTLDYIDFTLNYMDFTLDYMDFILDYTEIYASDWSEAQSAQSRKSALRGSLLKSDQFLISVRNAEIEIQQQQRFFSCGHFDLGTFRLYTQ